MGKKFPLKGKVVLDVQNAEQKYAVEIKMILPKCPKCKMELMVDEWLGWKLYCFNCDKTYRDATNEEIKEWDKQMEEYQKKKV